MLFCLQTYASLYYSQLYHYNNYIHIYKLIFPELNKLLPFLLLYKTQLVYPILKNKNSINLMQEDPAFTNFIANHGRENCHHPPFAGQELSHKQDTV